MQKAMEVYYMYALRAYGIDILKTWLKNPIANHIASNQSTADQSSSLM